MILTCPECATSYFADEYAIGASRTVRCSACAATWTVRAERPYELEVEADEAPEPAMEQVIEEEALLETPPSELPGEMLPKAFRARAESERRMREAALQGAVWTGLGAAFAAVIVTAVVFRIDVVRLWPRSASAYAAIGLPVNAVGLTIEDAHAQPSLQDGHPALLVSGVLRNVRPRTITAPPLSVILRDKDNQPLLTRVFSPGDPEVPPGQTRSFAISLVDPPAGAANVDIDFVIGRKAIRLKPTPAALPQLRPAIGGSQAMVASLSTVQDAQPLPAGSPYAAGGPASAP